MVNVKKVKQLLVGQRLGATSVATTIAQLSLITCLGIAFSLVIPSSARSSAEEFSFTKIADSNDSVPGTTAPFMDFQFPMLSLNNVVFTGSDEFFGDPVGYYTTAGDSLRVLADPSTLVPNSAGFFSEFGQFSFDIDGENRAFWARVSSPTGSGVYAEIDGDLVLIADQDTDVPGGTGTFGELTGFGSFLSQRLSIDSNKVAFAVNITSGTIAIYLFDTLGNGVVIADGSDGVIPEPGQPLAFDGNGNVLFIGDNGIYRNVSGVNTLVVDTSTIPPGRTGPLIEFRHLDSDGDVITFQSATADGGDGVFAIENGVLRLVADELTLAPEGVGNFVTLLNPVISETGVAFFGEGSGESFFSLFAEVDGELKRVVRPGDVLDTGTVEEVTQIDRDGNEVVFRAFFEGGPFPLAGPQGIYVVSLGGDSDGDGIADDLDNCPTVPNAGQEQTGNNVGGPFGDACVDPMRASAMTWRSVRTR